MKIKQPEFEVVLRQKSTKDLVMFDFGLLFKRGSDEIQIYIDPELRKVIDSQLEDHEQLIVKVNYFSPDVITVVSE